MSFSPGAGGGIASATDVALSNAADAHILTYDGATAKWKNLGPNDSIITFTETSILTVKAGTSRFYFPFNAKIMGIQASVGTPPEGQIIRVNVLKNGTSVFTGTTRVAVGQSVNVGAERVEIDFTAGASTVTTGDYLTISIDQIGTTTAGSDLVLNIRYRLR